MKKIKKNLLGFAYALPAMLLIAGCGNSTDPVFETNEPVELQITPTVALTRGVIAGGAQSGGTGHITDIAVYATGTDYTDGNNYAKYSYSGGSWGNSDAGNKIYLTNAVATLYAYHPTTTKVSSNTIPVTVLASGTIATASNASTAAIAAAPTETDYLYATSATADNTTAKRSVALTMNHALSMVSFRVYGENYKGPGKLTQIVLKNADNKTALTKGSTNTMNITDGDITQTAPTAAATYTRTITGYTLGTTSGGANKLSILVLPISGKTIPTDEIKAVFTIDGAVYSVSLTDPTDANGWLAGNNNLYTVKLSGTELSISKVEVTAWAEKVGGELDIK